MTTTCTWGATASAFRASLQLEALRTLQKQIGEANAAKGFHDRGNELRTITQNTTRYEGKGPTPTDEALRDYYAARLALITTEVAEAIEELRNGRAVDETWYENPPLTAEALTAVADDVRAGRATPPRPHKPEGVPSELADIVIRAFDFAHEAGIDLAAMIQEKLAYNATRPAMHGRAF